jgi:GntR family transcriptional regulator
MEPGARDFSARLEPASVEVAAALDLTEGDPVVRIERVRTADGTAMAYETTNLPAARFPDLLERMSETDSLYEVLDRVYGVRPENAEQTVAIDRLSSEDAVRLETAAGEPCFAIERKAHDNMGKTVEFGRSLYRGDRYVIEMHVGRAADG